MPKKHYLFTSESVTEGHPDKIADQISDAILDACIKEDPYSRVACETLTATGLVVIAGEITTKAYVDFQSLVRGVVASIGYDNALYGFDSNTCAVISSINKQSGDIAMGVDTGGAGDQGMMFGYATNENANYMPTPIFLAHKLCERLTEVRKNGMLPYLRPDGKSQVTVEYDENHKPVRIDAVVISSQHSETVSNEDLRADILKHVIQAVAAGEDAGREHQVPHQSDRAFRDRRTDGRHRTDGPQDHRRHATAAWAVTAAARSAARIRPRSIARRATWRATSPRTSWRLDWRTAAKCSLPMPSAWLSRSACWSIPSVPAKIDEDKIADLVRANFKLTPKGIIESLNLRRPIYRKTAAYGHFGRNDPDFTWEATDKAAALREQAGLAGANAQKSAQATK